MGMRMEGIKIKMMSKRGRRGTAVLFNSATLHLFNLSTHSP